MNNNKTWWGEKFLEALTSFIDEGRLNRGKAYRTPNRLSKYLQKGNSVSATMTGNKNPYFGVYKVPYYKTKITFSKLQNADLLSSNIENDPLLLAKLITRELPKTIASILPQNSNDIETSCSCPDWQNPCKHIAGLYFRIANEIDYNPLLLFELRGIRGDDISQKIKKYIHIPQDVHNQLISTKSQQIMNIKSFWGMPHRQYITSVSIKIPSVLIKKAGINPPFWYKRKPFIDSMDSLYSNIRRSWNKLLKML